MTKETKSVLKKTLKKYNTLAEYTKEDQEVYMKVSVFLQSLIEEEENK